MDFWATGAAGTERRALWGVVGVGVVACAAPALALAWSLEMTGTAAWFGAWAALGGVAIVLRTRLPGLAAVLFALSAPLFARVPLAEFEGAVRTAIDRAEDHQLSPLSARGLVAMHGLAAVSLRALGMETASDVLGQRHLDGPALRAVRSDLPMCDPVIRREVHRMWLDAAAGQSTFHPRPITWARWNEPDRSVAVAAAFDCGATLSGALVRPGELEVELRCAVDPPRRTTIYARSGTSTLTWDPELIHQLTLRGDLHAFAPVATWSVRADPGQDPDTCETLGTTLFRWVDAWARAG